MITFIYEKVQYVKGCEWAQKPDCYSDHSYGLKKREMNERKY